MRVLVFGMSKDKFGGIETFLLNMNKHMDGNCIFDYFVVGAGCIHGQRVKENGGEIFYAASYRKNPLKNLKDTITILRKCRRTHDTAYFNLFSMVHVVPILLCRLFGYRIVLHSHNSNVKNKSRIYRGLHKISRSLIAGSKSVTRLACAPAAAEFMFGHGKNREAVMIYNAIERDRFCFSPEMRETMRTRLGLGDSMVVGFVGRLAPQKNPLFIVDVFERVAAKRPDFKLLLIGDGELKSAVARAINEKGLAGRVNMLPSQKNIEDYYQAMDVFLLPSLFEGLPVVLVETQTAGVPGVASSEAVPAETRVREDFIQFISLNDSLDKWADAVIGQALMEHDRAAWNDAVGESVFNIDTEARRLESILCS